VTQTQVDTILLELAEESNHGTSLVLDLEPNLWKNIFENKFKTFDFLIKFLNNKNKYIKCYS
jgi:hypothetical protein